MEFQVYKPDKHSIIIRETESGEFEAYIQEMPTVRAFGPTRAKAWVNCVMLTIDQKKESEED